MFEKKMFRLISVYRELIILIVNKKSKYESLKYKRRNAIINDKENEVIENFNKKINDVLKELSKLSAAETSLKYWLRSFDYIEDKKYIYFIHKKFLK